MERGPIGGGSRFTSPGVQLTGGNRQVRTTVPPLARGGTPVIAWAVVVGYLDVSSDEMSQTFTVLSQLPLATRFPSGLKLTLLT